MNQIRITGGSGTIPKSNGGIQKATFTLPLVSLTMAPDASWISISAKFLFRKAEWRTELRDLQRVEVSRNSIGFFTAESQCRFQVFDGSRLTPALQALKDAGANLVAVKSTAGIAWKL